MININWDSVVYAQQKIDDPIKKIIQDNIGASCTVYVQSGEDNWTGSGFHLGGGYVATAAHVTPEHILQDFSQIIITFDGKIKYSAHLMATEPDYDTAILYCKDIVGKIDHVILGDSNTLEVGDLIAVIGSPEGWHDTANTGRITNIHQSLGDSAPSEAWKDIIFIDAHILPGTSGGMVIATDGLVYGLVMGVAGILSMYGVGQNSVSPSNKIYNLIQRVQN